MFTRVKTPTSFKPAYCIYLYFILALCVPFNSKKLKMMFVTCTGIIILVLCPCRSYNMMKEGQFVLYRHKTLPFEVSTFVDFI